MAGLASINQAIKAYWRHGALILGLLLLAVAIFIVPRWIWTSASGFDAVKAGTGVETFALQGTRSPCPSDFGYYAFGYSFNGRIGDHSIFGVVCWSFLKRRWEWRFNPPDEKLSSDPNRV